MTYTATYSPDDNKLRLYASGRLPADEYARVRAAGFIWAPKQDLFVAPMWTPSRADLLMELCGEIGDEDTSLAERAEERAERFTDYKENRAEDANRAHKAVSAIADGIPLGQPILVGHHSERHARKDAERIQNGMRRAIKMWETSQYWQARAAGAIRHAKYKELPGVRARRIKGLEADRRKQVKDIDAAQGWIKMWSRIAAPGNDGVAPASPDLQLKRATYIANYSHISLPATPERPAGDSLWSALDRGSITPRAAQLVALKAHARTIAHARRWLAHTDLRLAYERAMLAEAGGLITDRSEFPIVAGGRVIIGGRPDEWLAVIRVNRSNGQINSLTLQAPAARASFISRMKCGIEAVKDYRPPTTEDATAVKAVKKLPPLVNVNGPDRRQMTTAEYKRATASGSGCTRVAAATAEHGAYRYRSAFKGGGGGDSFNVVSVFLTDAKTTGLPAPDDSPSPTPIKRVHEPRQAAPAPTPAADLSVYEEELAAVTGIDSATVEAMRQTVKAGVQVVAAPQLFPTPVDLARRVIHEAGIEKGHSILEPSAGTGRLIDSAGCADWEWSGRLVAVEHNAALAAGLKAKYRPDCVTVHHADFLTCNGNLGTFDRITMNPPFSDGQDIEHVRHAYGFLHDGGRLVAIMGEGAFFRGDRKATDFREWLDAVGGTSEQLPADAFKESGTGVRSRLVIIDK